MNIKHLQKTIGYQKDKSCPNLGDEWCEIECGYLNNKELIKFLEIGKEKTK